MHKSYKSLGLMSGTSGDGVDASLIKSNGIDDYELIKEKYFEYEPEIYKNFHKLKEGINKYEDITKLKTHLSDLERNITIFHSKIIKEFDNSHSDFLVGFHGQTIYHNSKEKISKQLGDGHLLHQLNKKKIVYNFRKNDIINGGEGAPLTPIFHQLIVTQKKIKLPVCILNIGGISNITLINEVTGSNNFYSEDIGPGNCLIDSWVRKNSDKKFDKNGKLASQGKKNEIILENAQELYQNIQNKKLSYDVNDFDVSFARGLSLEDGTCTLTEFTADIISNELRNSINKLNKKTKNILLCGGGRKNKILIEKIQQNLNSKFKLENIDNYGFDGDFIESQAFAFLAIRTILNLPLTFPNTTGCSKASVGGEIIYT